MSIVFPTYIGSCGRLFSCSWVNTELKYICVQFVGHVIVSGDNSARVCFEWSYIISNYSSLIDIIVEAFRVGFT